ncbi:Tryptase gamma [Coemansia guatemalensis]|uniref:Tryptase gamma n=1 Tax=Coemansia guatemalensis TaxID=2761395 RepID=A0A9W8HUU1_9FUNG|nr:Tryptase gamma [Coemansia guatemalensis]
MSNINRSILHSTLWLLYSLSIVSYVCALPSGKHSSNLMPRIMGGSNADFSKYPFIVYLYNEADKTFCGGSIISDQWVLTAAHCIKSASTSDLLVYVGQAEYNLDTSKGTKVSKIHNHPEYNDQSMVNDVSLLRLESPVTSDKATTITIDTTSVGDGETLTALGWGYTSPTGTTASKQLQKGDLKTLSKEQCGSIDTNFNGNDGPRICVAADAGPDTCPGDSGGPLIREVGGKNVLVGITSFGTAGSGQSITSNCGGKGMVSIFTHANYFKSFIDSSTGGLRQIEGEPKADGDLSNVDGSTESDPVSDSSNVLDLFDNFNSLTILDTSDASNDKETDTSSDSRSGSAGMASLQSFILAAGLTAFSVFATA